MNIKRMLFYIREIINASETQDLSTEKNFLSFLLRTYQRERSWREPSLDKSHANSLQMMDFDRQIADIHK